jgi:hypothetical protein
MSEWEIVGIFFACMMSLIAVPTFIAHWTLKK